MGYAPPLAHLSESALRRPTEEGRAILEVVVGDTVELHGEGEGERAHVDDVEGRLRALVLQSGRRGTRWCCGRSHTSSHLAKGGPWAGTAAGATVSQCRLVLMAICQGIF